jgi:hypothetical protein
MVKSSQYQRAAAIQPGIFNYYVNIVIEVKEPKLGVKSTKQG